MEFCGDTVHQKLGRNVLGKIQMLREAGRPAYLGRRNYPN
jgi:hypothetical protein